MRAVLQVSLLSIALSLSSVGVSASEELPDPFDTRLAPSQRLDALFARVRARHESMTSLEADFVQHKDSSIFLEPSVSSGLFSYAAPDRVRWDYEEPDPISLLITEDRMTTWYRDLARAETAGVKGHSQRILHYMGASTSVDKLVEYFTISLRVPDSGGEPFALRLTPKFKRVEKRIRELEIWIDSERYIPLRLRFVEGDGDVTEYEFSNLRLNEGIPDERFILDIPEDVQVREVELGEGSPGR